MAPPRRGFLKKLSLFGAVFSFTGALLALGLANWSWMTYGKHVSTGSLGATSFFFFSTAIVLPPATAFAAAG